MTPNPINDDTKKGSEEPKLALAGDYNIIPPNNDLREKLAAIEHERWAHWQTWLHSQLKKVPEGMLMTPKYYQHLEEQIAADYSELSDKEKASDMEQVDRYWPLIEEYIKADRNKLLDSILEADLPWPKDIFGEVPEEDWAKINEWAKKELGYPVDRISGDLMRHGWNVRQRLLREAVNELLTSDQGVQ